jgi:hypothetical protein
MALNAAAAKLLKREQKKSLKGKNQLNWTLRGAKVACRFSV